MLTTQIMSDIIGRTQKLSVEDHCMYDTRDALRELIKQKGYIQRAIAQKAGMSEHQLSGVLAKKRKLDSNEFLALCRALDTTPDDLFKTSA